MLDIKHTCGHTVAHDIDPNRARKIRHLAGHPCRDCQQAELDAKGRELEREVAELKAARENREELGLPALIGSAKQIAWAKDIRSWCLRSNTVPPLPTEEQVLKSAKRSGADFDKCMKLVRDFNEKILAARKRLETETSAKWWIDNRVTAQRLIFNEIKRAETGMGELISGIWARDLYDWNEFLYRKWPARTE
jgi:hypothetical protein